MEKDAVVLKDGTYKLGNPRWRTTVVVSDGEIDNITLYKDEDEFRDMLSTKLDNPHVWDLAEHVIATLERAEKLQAFKDFVHKRLDEMGIEKNPNGKHSAEGCRVGDRLDLIVEHMSYLKSEIAGHAHIAKDAVWDIDDVKKTLKRYKGLLLEASANLDPAVNVSLLKDIKDALKGM